MRRVTLVGPIVALGLVLSATGAAADVAGKVVDSATGLPIVASRYADPADPKRATCVDCHMKSTTRAQACNGQSPPLVRPEGEVRSHRFEGTSAEYLENAVALWRALFGSDIGVRTSAAARRLS